MKTKSNSCCWWRNTKHVILFESTSSSSVGARMICKRQKELHCIWSSLMTGAHARMHLYSRPTRTHSCTHSRETNDDFLELNKENASCCCCHFLWLTIAIWLQWNYIANHSIYKHCVFLYIIFIIKSMRSCAIIIVVSRQNCCRRRVRLLWFASHFVNGFI